MGLEVLERLRFLASLPLAGTAQTEGGGIRVANNGIIPHPFMRMQVHATQEVTPAKSPLQIMIRGEGGLSLG